MQKPENKLNKTIAGIIALGAGIASGNVQAVPDQPAAWEKCAGVALAGKNDCGALDGKHSCAGQASKDNDSNEWIYVAEGTCTKITGGKVAAVKPAKK